MNEGFDYKAVADAAARVAIELWEKKQKAVGVRHFGLKAIAAAVAKTAGVPVPSPTTIRAWKKSKGFPMDRGPLGPVVSQWALERWLAEVYDDKKLDARDRGKPRRAA